MKTKVLAICNKGKTRSRYLANYLKEKGYSTRWGGVSKNAKIKLTQDKINWADKIIVSDRIVMKKLKERFKLPKKSIIMLNVFDDASRGYPKKATYIVEDAHRKFRENYVFPKLRKQIEGKL